MVRVKCYHSLDPPMSLCSPATTPVDETLTVDDYILIRRGRRVGPELLGLSIGSSRNNRSIRERVSMDIQLNSQNDNTAAGCGLGRDLI